MLKKIERVIFNQLNIYYGLIVYKAQYYIEVFACIADHSTYHSAWYRIVIEQVLYAQHSYKS